MTEYRIARWADNPSEICNRRDQPLFKEAELCWTKPVVWSKAERQPYFDTTEPFVYALIRNHGKSYTRDHIEYLGLTATPKTRFGNHKKARQIVNMRGEVKFTYAPIDFISGRNRINRIDKALEEIEHLLIWAIGGRLRNERKKFTLPGMGQSGANAWYIRNSGYRFAGQMPREIVFPWMLVKPGRNRSWKNGKE